MNVRPPTRPTADRPTTLDVIDCGRAPYGDVFALQQRHHADVLASRDDGPASRMVLLFVEHDPPVITVSRRRGARDHLIATRTQLDREGVVIEETNRGGDITYHGPGQLVVYPILDLNVLGLRLHGYVRWLEQVVIDVLAAFNLTGYRDGDATGVWVDHGGRSAKICAVGVRISRWVTLHGFALNVTTNLSHFDLIVPCGLAGRPVTSMARLLGPACPTIEVVRDRVTARIRQDVDDGA